MTDLKRHWPAALAGVLAAGLGLGIAELLAGALGRAITPVSAVGETVIALSPGALNEWAIGTFGTANKAILIAGVLVVFALLAAGIGLLTARRRGLGVLAAAALGLVALVAVYTRPDAQAYDLLPVIVGMAAAVLVLLPLVRSAEAASAPPEAAWAPPERVSAAPEGAAIAEPPASPETSPQPVGRPGRRTFLRVAAAVGAVAAGAGGIGQWLGSRRVGVESSREDLAAPQALPRNLPEPAVPDGVNVQVPDVAPWRTPNDDFYLIDTALSKPLVQPEDWSLRVHGMVEEELMLSFDDLVSIGLIDRWITLCCVSNQVGGDLIGNALWTGVRTSDVLGMAGPLADADAVKSVSYDGWNCGTPLEALTDGRDSMFAVAMNGEPLPVEHGFPVRMVVPGLYGYVSATKWVVNVEVTRFDQFEAYWTERGWAERGPVKVQSRIDVPSSGAGLA
ncbi:MAG: molybdopterin-dependent oxidoreductase, partial [Actinomycetota bacterium]